MVVEYDGTGYFGMQIQPKKKTVQGVIQNALGKLFNREQKICFASRTDAGVHALHQVVHFDVTDQEYEKFSTHSIILGINHFLGKENIKDSLVKNVEMT